MNRHGMRNVLGAVIALALTSSPVAAQRPGFVSITNAFSNLCLGVQGVDSHVAGGLVEVYTCNPPGIASEDQQWRIVPQNDGTKRIENRVSGLCLGVQGADSHSAGAQVEVYDCNSRRFPVRDQHWRF